MLYYFEEYHQSCSFIKGEAEESTAVIHGLHVCSTKHSHISGIGFGTSLNFSQTYLFCTAANNESNCWADSVPRTIPQPTHVHSEDQSLLKSILRWARSSREKTSSKSPLIHQWLPSCSYPVLLFTLDFLTWNRGLAYTLVRVKLSRGDVLLRKVDFFKVRAVVEKFSVLCLFHRFLLKCQEIRFIKPQSFPFLAGYDKLILIFSSLITSLHSYWQTGSVCGGSDRKSVV